jgi:hypothetical protein
MIKKYGGYFLAVFLALPITVYGAQSDTKLTLTSESLGPLPLSKETLVSESYLKQLFPKYKITHEIGQGDSPNFHYFEIKDSDGELLFTIKSFIEDSDQQSKQPTAVRIDLLQVRSPRIRDVHGLRVGSRVKDIIKAIGRNLDFGAGHHDVYLGADRIFYNIRTNSEWSPERFTLNDAVRGNWQVISISWPSAAWE